MCAKGRSAIYHFEDFGIGVKTWDWHVSKDWHEGAWHPFLKVLRPPIEGENLMTCSARPRLRKD